MNPQLVYEQPEPGRIAALALTLLVHLALLAVLFFGVQWKQQRSDSVEAELWSERPQPSAGPVVDPVEPSPRPTPAPPRVAAPKVAPLPPPKAVTPPPPLPRPVTPVAPARPDIALRDDRKKDKPKEPPPKPQKPLPPSSPPEKPAKPEKPEKPRLPDLPGLPGAPSAADELRQVRGAQEAAATERAAAAATRSRNDKAYKDKIVRKIRGNVLNLPNDIEGNPEAVFEITQLPTGEVIAVHLRRSSGHSGLDMAVERAIMRASPLPKPDDPELFQRQIIMKYRPHDR